MTNVTTLVSNFMYRRGAERVETEEPHDNNSIAEEDGEEGQFLGTPTEVATQSFSTGNISDASSQQTFIIEALPDDEDANTSRNHNIDIEMTEDATIEDSPENSLTADAEPSGSTAARTTSTSRRRNALGFTLRDLEEERELIQRRTGGCVFFSSFFLLYLWIQALMSGDFGLLMLCLVFTNWTARFVRFTREREEDLNRMINEWDETADEEPSNNDARLSTMSFQSQLALALVQSQIQMMGGGYGHPDGGANKPGVSDEAKDRWDRFEYKSISSLIQRGDYGSDIEQMGEPTCSICLCEYEEGDRLVSLPCKHVFHEDCIASWTDHNTRCPLCNADLNTESVDEVV